MKKLNIEQCPETGICSIIKENGTKVDLMPGEVADILGAAGDMEKIKSAIGDADPSFAEALDTEELAKIAEKIK